MPASTARPSPTGTPDTDTDGYGDASATATAQCDAPTGSVEDNTDCDDGDADINPDAAEVCDSVDNDCDTLVDDDDPSLDTSTATDWAPDTDGDGYGDDDSVVRTCTAPSGYISVLGDCDDDDFDINPGAQEVCDADDTDEDCDGLVDDEDPSVDTSTGSGTWYVDADGDGYGDASSSGEPLCDTPSSGYVSDNTDCDDDNDTVYRTLPRCATWPTTTATRLPPPTAPLLGTRLRHARRRHQHPHRQHPHRRHVV